MKANELMIGDWVFCTYKQQNYKVAEIKTVASDDLKVVVYDENTPLVFPMKYFEPISLTDEILRNNGFEFSEAEKLINVRRSMCHLSRMNGEYKYVNKTRKGILIDCAIVGYSDLHKKWQIVQMFGKNMVIDAGEVNSVHELQQAMRLCGIDKEIKIK